MLDLDQIQVFNGLMLVPDNIPAQDVPPFPTPDEPGSSSDTMDVLQGNALPEVDDAPGDGQRMALVPLMALGSPVTEELQDDSGDMAQLDPVQDTGFLPPATSEIIMDTTFLSPVTDETVEVDQNTQQTVVQNVFNELLTQDPNFMLQTLFAQNEVRQWVTEYLTSEVAPNIVNSPNFTEVVESVVNRYISSASSETTMVGGTTIMKQDDITRLVGMQELTGPLPPNDPSLGAQDATIQNAIDDGQVTPGGMLEQKFQTILQQINSVDNNLNFVPDGLSLPGAAFNSAGVSDPAETLAGEMQIQQEVTQDQQPATPADDTPEPPGPAEVTNRTGYTKKSEPGDAGGDTLGAVSMRMAALAIEQVSQMRDEQDSRDILKDRRGEPNNFLNL